MLKIGIEDPKEKSKAREQKTQGKFPEFGEKKD